jgi:hypothetical protein
MQCDDVAGVSDASQEHAGQWLAWASPGRRTPTLNASAQGSIVTPVTGTPRGQSARGRASRGHDTDDLGRPHQPRQRHAARSFGGPPVGPRAGLGREWVTLTRRVVTSAYSPVSFATTDELAMYHPAVGPEAAGSWPCRHTNFGSDGRAAQRRAASLQDRIPTASATSRARAEDRRDGAAVADGRPLPGSD